MARASISRFIDLLCLAVLEINGVCYLRSGHFDSDNCHGILESYCMSCILRGPIIVSAFSDLFL
jgi:hypothetical protein